MCRVRLREGKGRPAKSAARRVRIPRDGLSCRGSTSGGIRDGFKDLHVACAAAEIAAEAFADFFERGPRLFVEQMQGRDNHTWSANAALRATTVEEGLLQHLQAAVGCESFNRNNF